MGPRVSSADLCGDLSKTRQLGEIDLLERQALHVAVQIREQVDESFTVAEQA
ncbi:MAG: hypothetical protein WAW96_09310 [Alphaproteobacteria bacterium]